MIAFLAICVLPAALVGALRWAMDRIYQQGYDQACADLSRVYEKERGL